MRLIACPVCHTQYDVEDVSADTIACRCGESLANREPVAIDAVVHRCSSCSAQVSPESDECHYCGANIVRDLRKLSLICPECGGRNADDARFCVACGVGFSPEPIPTDGKEVQCPCCSVLMPPQSVGGVTLNECPECNGLWVPEDNLDTLLQRALKKQQESPQQIERPRVKGANPSRQSVAYRKCPECEQFMQRKNFLRSSGVILDRCGHGTWLDADELEQIVGFLLAGGAQHYEPEKNLSQQKVAEAFAKMQAADIARRYETPEHRQPDGLLGVLARLLR